jgi:hypothetical protein
MVRRSPLTEREHRQRAVAQESVLTAHASTIPHVPVPRFYFGLSLVFATVAFVGFTPTYVIPAAAGRFDGVAMVHLHGLLFFAWTVLVLQARLARASPQTHRALGLAGISLATAMFRAGGASRLAADRGARLRLADARSAAQGLRHRRPLYPGVAGLTAADCPDGRLDGRHRRSAGFRGLVAEIDQVLGRIWPAHGCIPNSAAHG